MRFNDMSEIRALKMPKQLIYSKLEGEKGEMATGEFLVLAVIW